MILRSPIPPGLFGRLTRLLTILLCAAAVLLCQVAAHAQEAEHADAEAFDLDALGAYERSALEEGLERLGLAIDPAPSGKKIAQIHVVNLEVFGPEAGALPVWFNRFHWTTLPSVIEREVLLEPGDAWDAELADETERLLRDPVFTSVVVVAPVRSATPDAVDVLVVTRDIWSLRLNSNFEIQDGELTALFVSLSENNFLGRRKALAFYFDMDQGAFTVGPRYFDSNLLGSGMQLSLRGGPVFERGSGELEGSQGAVGLSYPFRSLSQPWAASLSTTFTDRVIRRFQGTQLLPYEAPDSVEADEADAVGQAYRLERIGVEARLTRSMGSAVKHRLTAGYLFTHQDPRLREGFPEDPALREAFARDVLPRSEQISALVLGYRFFVPQWVTYRDIATYDLPEDIRVGPYATVELSPAPEFLGTDEGFVGLYGLVGWLGDLGGEGYGLVEGYADSRLYGRDLRDNAVGGRMAVASPLFFGVGRLVARSALDVYLDDSQNRLLFAGGTTGLRGYPIGAFTGSARWLSNLELRSQPLRLLFTRVGLIAFWDAGHAAEGVGVLRPRHDIGLGLRLLIPQANVSPLRFDWAFPVDEEGVSWPGRTSLGFQQVF